MNNAARINLQRGIQEDKSKPETTYNIECAFDVYLINRNNIKKRVEELRNREALEREEKKEIERVGKEIAAAAAREAKNAMQMT